MSAAARGGVGPWHGRGVDPASLLLFTARATVSPRWRALGLFRRGRARRPGTLLQLTIPSQPPYLCAEPELLVRARTPLRAHVDDSTVRVGPRPCTPAARSRTGSETPASRTGGRPYQASSLCVPRYRQDCSDDGVDREPSCSMTFQAKFREGRRVFNVTSLLISCWQECFSSPY